MAPNREVIDVAVNRGILWVGSDAYPLNNIARAQTLRLEPDRAAATRRYAGAVVLCAVLAVGATIAVHIARSNAPHLLFLQTHGSTLTKVSTLAAIALAVVSTLRFLYLVLRRTYYALIIETAGAPRAALVSLDRTVVTGLVAKIMYAIGDPHADFRTTIENIHIGDNIHQSGSNNVLKAAR